MNVERLMLLAEFLTTVEEPKFCLLSWREMSESQENDVAVTDAQLFEDCGTAACAMGWATAMPEFKELGLYFDVFDDDIAYTPKDKHTIYKGYSAARYFFEFKEHDTAYFLFSPMNYVCMSDIREYRDATKEEVIERINKLISFKGTNPSPLYDEIAFQNWCRQQNQIEANRFAREREQEGQTHGS